MKHLNQKKKKKNTACKQKITNNALAPRKNSKNKYDIKKRAKQAKRKSHSIAGHEPLSAPPVPGLGPEERLELRGSKALA